MVEFDDKLSALRENVLKELVQMSSYIAEDIDAGYELLLILARNTGDQSLLEKAFIKIQALEDPREKSDALVDLLDEIEASLTPFPESQLTDAQDETQNDRQEDHNPEIIENN